jgi:hypothetical protein
MQFSFADRTVGKLYAGENFALYLRFRPALPARLAARREAR